MAVDDSQAGACSEVETSLLARDSREGLGACPAEAAVLAVPPAPGGFAGGSSWRAGDTLKVRIRGAEKEANVLEMGQGEESGSVYAFVGKSVALLPASDVSWCSRPPTIPAKVTKWLNS